MALDGTHDSATTERIRVGVAEFAVATDGTVLATSGLGSCLGVALHDADAGVAGLAHPMRPSDETGGEGNPGKFVDAATTALVASMADHGADRASMTAKLAGGSEMFSMSFGESGVGERNVARARGVLDELGIPVVAEDVGGDSGRSVKLRAGTGELIITRANGDDAVL